MIARVAWTGLTLSAAALAFAPGAASAVEAAGVLKRASNAMGATELKSIRYAAEGIIDRDNRVFGYENLFVCDGSMISANPGVNPSLSITAISERAMSRVPPRGAHGA